MRGTITSADETYSRGHYSANLNILNDPSYGMH